MEAARPHPRKILASPEMATAARPRQFPTFVVEQKLGGAEMPVRPGDRFVLRSGGLFDPVSSAEILPVVRGAGTAESCEKLLRMARQRGGCDNITVAVTPIPDGVQAPAAPKATREYEVLP